MLKLRIPETELFDDETGRFIQIKAQTLQMEHSLVSISKWEAKYKKPFLSENTVMTREEMEYYLQCMTLTQNVNPMVYKAISEDTYRIVKQYMNDSMTATRINDNSYSPNNGEEVTSELIYYWMVAHKIPCEYQKWHINRLLTLIRVCNHKNKPKNKRAQDEILAERWAQNQARREKYHTKG